MTVFLLFFKQKTANEVRISDWSSDVCSSDVPGPEVVHGDMLVLEAGDRVAADALVIEAQEMEADESLLTGEAVPVRKRTARTGEPDRAEPGGDDTPYLFSGEVGRASCRERVCQSV